MDIDSTGPPSFGNRFILVAADGRNAFWRYLLTLAVVLGFVIVGALPLTVLIAAKQIFTVEEMTPARLGVSSTAWLALNLIPFLTGLIGLLICTRYIHGRRISTLVTPSVRVNWRKVLFAAGVWGTLLALLECVNYAIDPLSYRLSLDLAGFVPLLLVSLTLLPIQTSLEELLFRGYLMQGIGLATRRGWVALITTSIVFGVMHLANPEVSAYGIGEMLPFYIAMGALLGLTVLFDEGVEIALGLHAANNIYTAVLVNYSNSVIPTSAVFTADNLDTTTGLFLWCLMAGLFLIIVARKYGWTDAAEKLGRIGFREVGSDDSRDVTPTDPAAPDPVPPPDDREP
jgi:membrane protease YdiL (CAAX protease family)